MFVRLHRHAKMHVGAIAVATALLLASGCADATSTSTSAAESLSGSVASSTSAPADTGTATESTSKPTSVNSPASSTPTTLEVNQSCPAPEDLTNQLPALALRTSRLGASWFTGQLRLTGITVRSTAPEDLQMVFSQAILKVDTTIIGPPLGKGTTVYLIGGTAPDGTTAVVNKPGQSAWSSKGGGVFGYAIASPHLPAPGLVVRTIPSVDSGIVFASVGCWSQDPLTKLGLRQQVDISRIEGGKQDAQVENAPVVPYDTVVNAIKSGR